VTVSSVSGIDVFVLYFEPSCWSCALIPLGRGKGLGVFGVCVGS
jgi:hypothetical protein